MVYKTPKTSTHITAVLLNSCRARFISYNIEYTFFIAFPLLTYTAQRIGTLRRGRQWPVYPACITAQGGKWCGGVFFCFFLWGVGVGGWGGRHSSYGVDLGRPGTFSFEPNSVKSRCVQDMNRGVRNTSSHILMTLGNSLRMKHFNLNIFASRW